MVESAPDGASHELSGRGSAPRPTSSPEKTRPSIYWVLASIALPPFSAIVKLRIRHGERLPMSGPFILAPNHDSEFDPLVMGVAVWKLGRQPRFMAKASLFKIPVVGWLLKRAGQIPVERQGSTRGHDPVSAAAQLVEHGQGVVVYPEGSLTRDPDLWPMRGKTGAVRIALTHKLPIIPAAHWGTQQVMPRYGKLSFFPRKRVEVAIGEAVDLSAFEGRPLDSKTLNEATEVVMQAITVLCEELRGEPAPRERWDPTKHDQKETGRFES
ncbi:lysophospholipid acyltransferase family protein [Plantibacter sp. YIM 135347]|uniref:lysophospholipid acyltransferase family protein n=1 Tax=Plantibacter sp. YIM 135347 TaxID=3423919 RepID=UPI003D3373E5